MGNYVRNNRNKAIVGGKLFRTKGAFKIVSSDEELDEVLGEEE
tara:strand:- start:20718 stop:20846 length:129 start_codon:yes stop_codon:yes gene_type:complete